MPQQNLNHNPSKTNGTAAWCAKNYRNAMKTKKTSEKHRKTFEKYMKEKEYDKVVNEIIELKLKHPLSDKDKLRIQKLQQKLNK